MQRLTTPTHSFVLDDNPSNWDEFRITYRQNGRIILEKDDITEMTVTQSGSKYTLSYQLTQEETKKFQPNRKVEVQIRAHYASGKTVASDIFVLMVDDVLNHEILGVS